MCLVSGRDLLVTYRQDLLRCHRHDAAGIEFRDEFIHDELAKPVARDAADGARLVRPGA